MKRCAQCKIKKNLEEFYNNPSAGKMGKGPYCKSCAKLRSKLWKANNKDKVKIHKRRGRLKKVHNLSMEDYIILLNNQNGCCAICGNKESKHSISPQLYVDHCHKTNVIRGLLCHSCNVGIGLFKDNISILESAIKYLKKEPSIIVNRGSFFNFNSPKSNFPNLQPNAEGVVSNQDA
jgi:hypothetical protein